MVGLIFCQEQAFCRRQQLPLSHGKVVLWHTARAQYPAAAILHLYENGRQPHLHVWNTVPPIRLGHTTVRGHQHDITNQTGKTICMRQCITGWHIRNDLFLKPTKTKAIVTCTHQQIAKLDQLCAATISRTELTFDEHITAIVHVCTIHMHALCHIQNQTDRDVANTITCSIVRSHLDYCNSILSVFAENNIGQLLCFQKVLAQVVCGAPYHLTATVLRCSLHWLPIKQRIVYKVTMMTSSYTSNHGTSPNLQSTTDRQGHCDCPGRTCWPSPEPRH